MRTVEAIVGVLWAAFWFYWLIAALDIKRRRWSADWYRGAGVQIVLVLAVLLALRAIGVGPNTLATVDDPWLQGPGVALLLAGLAIAVWARVHLGRNWGTPMSERVDAELVTSGPYRYVRHPIYSGVLLAAIGSALAVNLSWLLGALVAGGYFVYSATVEERTMGRLFPDQYPAYKRTTKMLIPFIL